MSDPYEDHLVAIIYGEGPEDSEPNYIYRRVYAHLGMAYQEAIDATVEALQIDAPNWEFSIFLAQGVVPW